MRLFKDDTNLGGNNGKMRLRFNIRLWLAVVGAGIVTWLIIRYGELLIEVIVVVFAAYLLNLAIRPLTDQLAQRKIPRSVTALVLYAVGIGLFYLLIQLTIPAIVDEFGGLENGGAQIMAELTERLENLPPLRQLNVNLETVFEMVAARAQEASGEIVSAVADITQVLIDILLILVLAYFFVVDRKIGPNLLFTWVPRHRRWRVRTVFANTSARLSRWIVAQIALALTFGILFGAGLLFMGIPFAISIAVLGAILEFVPFLGGAISLTLSILIALTFRPGMVIWIVLLYFAIQQLQINVLQPVLYGRAVDVHPAIILIALLVGAQLGGVIGALFAVPFAVVIMTLLDEIEKPGEAPPSAEEQAKPAERLPG